MCFEAAFPHLAIGIGAGFEAIDGCVADAGAGRSVAWMPSFSDARALLTGWLRRGDVCLVMGAGDVDALARSLVA